MALGWDGRSSGSSLRWKELSGSRLSLKLREIDCSRLGCKALVGSKLQGIMQSQVVTRSSRIQRTEGARGL